MTTTAVNTIEPIIEYCEVCKTDLRGMRSIVYPHRFCCRECIIAGIILDKLDKIITLLEYIS